MREDLLGYLLEALDDAERERVERALLRDPELQRQLEELKEQLFLLADDEEPITPPPGLAERTSELVAAHEDDVRDAVAAGHRTPWRKARLSARSQREPLRGSSATSLADLVVGAGIFLAASVLFLPAIAHSRFRSEITACQYNLQRLGDALTSFSQYRGGLFPQVPTIGNRGVAGVYAPLLVANQFLAEPRVLVCPASRLALSQDVWYVPTLDELDAASGPQLVRLQSHMGGSYGYTLGYVDDGRYSTHRNERRPGFGLLADAPSFHLPGHQSSNHGGRGQNVLYEDGQIRFLTSCFAVPGDDLLFLNREGFAEAGNDKQDAVIVASEIPPFPRQQ